ncbi:MAG: hypothetical protein ACFB10_01365 [Salibacteraceae bacterium]
MSRNQHYQQEAYMLLFQNPALPTVETFCYEEDQWQNWIGGIAAQGRFVAFRQLADNSIWCNEQGLHNVWPLQQPQSSISGTMVVRAANANSARQLAADCPIYQSGGIVEIRRLLLPKL